MSSKPIIAVLGATGSQGGSVVRFLSSDRTFAVRAITRHPGSAKAEELKSKYPEIEVVKGDLDDFPSLLEAFKGVHGVFGVTNFWEGNYDVEIRQGKNIVDAAKEAGVKHVAWSTLDNTKEIHVAHFDSKSIIDDYLKQSGVPRTSIYTTFYIENFANPGFGMAPKKAGDAYVLPLAILPDAVFPVFPVNDFGAWVLAVFKDPEAWIGQDLKVVTEWVTMKEVAATASRVSGKNVLPLDLDQASFEATRNDGYPAAEEIYLNMLFFVKYGYEGGMRTKADYATTWKLYPNATTLENFVKENQQVLFP